MNFSRMTDTDDYTGSTLEDIEPALWSKDALSLELSSFLGPQQQIPPLYSAIKQNGKKLYERMRKGENVDIEEVKKKNVEIFKIDLLEFNFPNVVIDVSCSEGTYIRSIARDLGGHLSKLERIESNGFSLANSYKLEELETLEPDELLDKLIKPINLINLKPLYLSEKQSIDLQQGKRVFVETQDKFEKEEFIQCISDSQELIGLASVLYNKGDVFFIQPKVVL